MAKESAQRFNREVKIHAHHADIKDSQFNVDWFQSFSIVFNALDNLSARRHVNRMCLAADVPLIESGTTGLNGQVQVIKKGRSECYDCNIKEPPKTYPVCTIRSTPSQPIHCIVWAKSYLFPELFGTSEEDAADLDRDAAADEQQEVEKLKQESQALQRIARHMDFDNFVEKVFRKVYEEDIERLRSMEDVWKNRRPPEILDFSDLSKAAKKTDLAGLRNQATWSVAESFAVFEKSLRLLGGRLQSLRARQVNGENPPSLIFDKDDEDALDLVTASANLRSSVFGIDLKSKFDVKRMYPFPQR